MAADDGHNNLLQRYCSPSFPFFEEPLKDHRLWIFPPLDCIGIVLKFLLEQSKTQSDFFACILVPNKSRASWFKYVPHFKRRRVFTPGTDMFRVRVDDSFTKLPKIKEAWFLLSIGA